MNRISIGRLVRRWLMLLIAVAVVAFAGFCVYWLHGIFGAHDSHVSAGWALNEPLRLTPSMSSLSFSGRRARWRRSTIWVASHRRCK